MVACNRKEHKTINVIAGFLNNNSFIAFGIHTYKVHRSSIGRQYDTFYITQDLKYILVSSFDFFPTGGGRKGSLALLKVRYTTVYIGYKRWCELMA